MKMNQVQEKPKTLANYLFQQRKDSFEKTLDSICEEIVSTSYCNQLLTSDFRYRNIKNMETFIELYLNSEREIFLSALLSKICPNVDFPFDSELAKKLNSSPQIRKFLLSFSMNPNIAKNLSTFSLANHFFFEASLIKSNSLQIRAILFDFSQSFLSEISRFRLQMKNSILLIVQQCQKIIRQQKEGMTNSDEIQKFNDAITKIESSHFETEKALTAEIEQLKIHSHIANDPKVAELEVELKHEKGKNAELIQEILDKTEKLRTFYAIQADLEDKTAECEMWKKRAENSLDGSSDSNFMEQIAQLKKENEELQSSNDKLLSTNTSITKDLQTLKKTISDKNTILKQSLACIEKLQQSVQNKEREINSLKEQIANDVKKDNTAKLLTIIEKLKKKNQKLAQENENKNKQIDDLKKDLETVKDKFMNYTKMAQDQIEQANLISQKQDEEIKLHVLARQELEKMKNDEKDKQSNTNESESQNDNQNVNEIEMKIMADSIKLKAENAELTTQNYLLQTKVDEHMAQMKKIASSYARAKEEIKSTKETIAAQKTELSDCKIQIEQLKNEIKEKADENQSLTQSIRKLMKQKDNKDESKRITALLDENVAQDSRIKELTNENNEQKTLINHLKSEIDPLTQQVETLNDKLASSKREILALQTAKKEIQARASNEQTEISEQNFKLKKQVDELQVQLNKVQNDKQRSDTLLKSTMDEYEKEIRGLTEQMEEKRIAHEKIIASLEQSKSKLQTELDTERSNTKLEKKKVKETLKQIDSLTSQIQVENTKRQSQCEVIIEMKEELSDFQNEIRQISYAIFQENDMKPLNEILQEIRRLKLLLEQLTDTNMQQANLNDSIKKKLENEKTKNKTYAEKIHSLKHDLKQAKQNKSDKEESFQATMQELNDTIKNNESQYQQALKKMQSQFVQQIQRLQADLVQEQKKKEENIQKYDEIKAAKSSVQQELEKTQQKVKNLEGNVVNVTVQKDKLAESLKEMKNQKKQLTETLNQLQAKSEKWQKDNQEIISKNNAYQNILNQVQAIISVSAIENVPEFILKLKSENDLSQRFMKNARKIMQFTDDADFFVKLTSLVNQQQNILRALNESGIQTNPDSYDLSYCVKELAKNQRMLDAVRKENEELEMKLAKRVQ